LSNRSGGDDENTRMVYRPRDYLLRLSSDHHRFNGRWSLVGGNGEFT